MRSGKDTVAGFLVDRGFQRFAFADRLKELASELFDVPPGEKNRALLVALGRKMCELDRDVWVNHVLRRIPIDGRVVVSDVRFPYEANALRAAGFYLARIDCDYRVRLGRLAKTEGLDAAKLMFDESEVALDDWDDWDFRLYAGKGLYALKVQATAMADTLLRGER